MELRVLLAERVSTRGMTARGDAEVSRAGLVGLAGHETPRATRRYVKAHRASARIGSRLHPQAFRDDFLYTAGLDNPGLLAQVAEGTLVATSTGKTSGSCMRCFDQRLTSTGWSMKSRSRSISVLGWHAVRKMLRRRVSPVCQKRIKTRSPGRIFTFRKLQDGSVAVSGIMAQFPARGGIHDTTSIRNRPSGSLLSDDGKPRICSDLPATL